MVPRPSQVCRCQNAPRPSRRSTPNRKPSVRLVNVTCITSPRHRCEVLSIVHIVCLCLFCRLAYLRNHIPEFYQILCRAYMLTMAVVRSSLVALRHVMWCSSTRKLPQLPSRPLSVAGTPVSPVTAVRDLGAVSYTHLRSPRDRTRSRMPSSA